MMTTGSAIMKILALLVNADGAPAPMARTRTPLRVVFGKIHSEVSAKYEMKMKYPPMADK